MESGTCIIEGTNSAAAYIDPGSPTCHKGNTLDVYMVSGGLALAAETKVEGDTPIYAHYLVRLSIGANLSKYMGQIIKRPMAFQGLTRKEARTRDVPEDGFTKKKGTLGEDWKRWNESSENHIGQVE
eukprot:12830923-Heterocapsa_arctica.AAC.1